MTSRPGALLANLAKAHFLPNMDPKLLRNATIISWDEASSSVKVLRNSSMLIIEDEITAITSDPDRLEKPAGTEVVDMTGKILTPGFVNTHCHLWQTALRSMSPDTFIAQYFGWLSQMDQVTASFSPRDIYISTLEGYCEGLNAGVTSFVDHASVNWRRDVIAPSCKAAVDGGARVWWCYDLNTFNPAQISIEDQCETLREVESRPHPPKRLVSMGFAFDGFDLSTEASVEQMKQIARSVEYPSLKSQHSAY